MNPVTDIYGIYVPSFALLALTCYIAYRYLQRLLGWLGFYRHVWHRALFDISLYLTLLSATVLLLEKLLR
ncbi:DUF1656 domain-containing protein|uniref:DUF1656 domain-containing protein n=1 Tax=Stenotrophomonas sp. SbOxS2 TaxID=2723885 RepID=UPI0015D41FED|nr:DUF1656 domain-containing protein [Stenotrophomonas sp. SbOxS2]NYT99369.1 DUF1656 domain-containing protein [Stenotrophomonas sp. SbOxS2]